MCVRFEMAARVGFEPTLHKAQINSLLTKPLVYRAMKWSSGRGTIPQPQVWKTRALPIAPPLRY